ncbi:MAG TPA: carboxypeptidase regulatory-like domain-containing protein [Bryobacteraceae bacterium]|nr:carboxypeptidase regulatory-like domain-containing protein [Bryobacteraceae bacterium]
MKNVKTGVRLTGVLCALVLAFSALPVRAQSDAARLQGVVSDQSGAVVPGAKVKVTEVATGRVLEATTGAGTGAFSFPTLRPGEYVVEITQTGFKAVKQNVRLEVAQVANMNFTLETGAVTEEVVVTEQGALVDSASSDMGLTVESKQIVDLPLNGRNFTQLATLVPGVTRGVPGNIATGQGNNAETFRNGSSGGASLVVNGARPQANNFMLDGVDNNESLVNTIVFFPPAEAIQEFKVQTSIAPAEFGRAGGAVVNTALKSGTNEIHGSAFEFLRNSQLDATPDFASSKPPFRRNQFGGTIGAPIVKNKLFVFGDYEGFRQATPVGVDFASVPTPLMRQGNFSELLDTSISHLSAPIPIINLQTGAPFPGNIIPSNLQNPVGLKYLNAYPLPNLTGKLQQNWEIERQQVQNFDNFDTRIDWSPSDRDRVFGRVSYSEANEVTSTRLPGLPAGFGSGTQLNHDRGAAAGFTHTFTPSLLSDFRIGFQRTFFGYTPPYDNVPLSANLGIPNANTSPLLGGGALIGGFNSQLEYTGDYGPYLVPQNTYQAAETASWVKGNHTVKFGANIIRRQVNLFRPIAGKGFFNLNGNGIGPGSTGYEVADILAGFVNNYQIGPPFGMVGTRTWENALFVQDDWRASRRLTVNLGLRWDYLSFPVEANGRQANFNLATGALQVASGGGDPLVGNNYHNFGPRAGFAYDFAGNGKTVLRGGYGIFYFLDRGGISNQLAQNPPFSGNSQYNYSDGYRITLSGQAPLNSTNWLAATAPLPLGNFNNLNLANPQNVNVLADLMNNKNSMMEQWNLQVQREVVNNTVFSIAYVGAAGHHLVDYWNENNQLFNTPNGTRLFPNLGSVTVEAARGNSIYHGLQTELTRRFSKGLQFTASYTFSRTIDDGGGAFGAAGPQDFLNLALERARADQDVRSRFVLSGVYELPFGKGRKMGAHLNRAEDAVLGGWQLNGIWTVQSGLPFGVGSPGGSPGGRADLVGNPMISPGDTQAYLNINAFAGVPLNSSGVMIRPGNLGRNVFSGPGINSVDLSLFKDFRLTERFKMEFRAESFNIANHPEYGQPNTDLNNRDPHTGFGTISSTLQSSERQMQFALRLFF